MTELFPSVLTATRFVHVVAGQSFISSESGQLTRNSCPTAQEMMSGGLKRPTVETQLQGINMLTNSIMKPEGIVMLKPGAPLCKEDFGGHTLTSTPTYQNTLNCTA